VTIANDDDLSISYSGIRPTVSEAGDLNHDGYADIVIGLGASSNPNGAQERERLCHLWNARRYSGWGLAGGYRWDERFKISGHDEG
jgi:hypothetical protein